MDRKKSFYAEHPELMELHRVHITPEDAVKFLRDCHHRRGVQWYGDVLEVLYDGVWRHVYETDIKDHVGIGCEGLTLERAIRMAATSWGIRLKPDALGILTRYSDG